MNRPHRRWLDDGARSALLAAAVAGAATFAAGLAVDPRRAWADLLIVNFSLLSISLVGAVFVAIQYATSGGWATLFRRVPEAMTGYLPAGIVGTAAVLAAVRTLYPWAAPGAVELARGKEAFLDVAAFRLRAGVCLGTWYLLVRALVSNSRAQDAGGEAGWTARNVRLSALFLVAFAFTYSLASIDWLMSLEPRWFSTIYPWYVFGGAFVQGLAALTLLVLALRRRGFFPELNSHHLHDLGKLVFAFSVFWAYLWFSQYLLIWYSNIPEETAHYVARLQGGWTLLFWLNPIVNFAAPFFILLSARSKSHERSLALGCGVVVLGHVLDWSLMVLPSLFPSPGRPWLEAGVLLGGSSLFLLLFDRSFSRARPVPSGDPYLVESLHHHA